MEEKLLKNDDQTNTSANNNIVENLEPEVAEQPKQKVIDDKKNKSLETKIGLLCLCVLVIVALH